MNDAQQLKKVRKQLGLTQSEMATEMGYAHQQSISKIERGNKNLSGPARRCLELIAEKNGIEKGRHFHADLTTLAQQKLVKPFERINIRFINGSVIRFHGIARI